MIRDDFPGGFLVVSQGQNGRGGAIPPVAIDRRTLVVLHGQFDLRAAVVLAKFLAQFVFDKPYHAVKKRSTVLLASNVAAVLSFSHPPSKPKTKRRVIARVDKNRRLRDGSAYVVAKL